MAATFAVVATNTNAAIAMELAERPASVPAKSTKSNAKWRGRHLRPSVLTLATNPGGLIPAGRGAGEGPVNAEGATGTAPTRQGHPRRQRRRALSRAAGVG